MSTECRDEQSQECRGSTRGCWAGTTGSATPSASAVLRRAGRSPSSTALYERDYATGSRAVAPLDPDLLLGEMSFVPNPGAEHEDDGVLMGYGYHRGRDEGQLVLLDAATL